MRQYNFVSFTSSPTFTLLAINRQLSLNFQRNLMNIFAFAEERFNLLKNFVRKIYRDRTRADYLGWVQCRACKEYMHASCAGYRSLDELRTSLICSPHRCPPCNVEIYKNSPKRLSCEFLCRW